MLWPIVSQPPNIISVKILMRVFWTGCQRKLKRNYCMWDFFVSVIDIATLYSEDIRHHYLLDNCWSFICCVLTQGCAILYKLFFFFIWSLYFQILVCVLQSFPYKNSQCFQHWTSILELLKHFWASYPITTSYLYAKVNVALVLLCLS